MRALRIYLLVYHGPNVWDISTHQNVKSLLEGWSNARATSPQCAAVVHVGFDRPETPAVLDLLLQYPERVLVTASARWTLPSAFSFTSSPIGNCVDPHSAEDIPVYLGTEGWGYVIDDVREPKEGEKLVAPPIVNAPLTGWLAALYEKDIVHFAGLVDQGIDSDQKYLEQRAGLPESLRDFADVERFCYLSQLIDSKDLIEVLQIAPLRVLESSVARLSVSVRVGNVLKVASILTIGDILKLGIEELRKLPNLGLKSTADLTRAVLNFIQSQIPKEKLKTIEQEENIQQLLIEDRERCEQHAQSIRETEIRASTAAGNLFYLISESIDALLDKDKLVMQSRLAMCGPRLTLEEIAKKLDVTRERVRQIEAKIISKILNANVWCNAISAKLSKLLLQRNEPLFVNLLEIEDPWFAGFTDKSAFLAAVIDEFTSGQFKTISVDGRDAVTRISKDDWETLKADTKAALRDTVYQKWSETEVKLFVEAMASDKSASELSSTLLKFLAPEMHFSNGSNDHKRVLVAFGRAVEQIVMAVLEEAEAPLHYSEIFQRVQLRADREVEMRRVHNACKACGGKLFGRGTYGLMKHCTLSETEIRNILAEVEEIILTHPHSKQWHCAELVDLLAERQLDLSESVTPYVLSMILERSKHLTYLGRLVWVAHRDRDETNNMDRIDLAQACVSLLKQAGHPLSAEDLKSRVSELRGVNPGLQIHQSEQLFLVAPNIWGLLDRDNPLSQTESRVLLDGTYNILLKRGKALHISEIADALKATGISLPQAATPYLLFSLANKDSRFHLAKGQLLALEGWDDLGRMTLSQAVRKIVDAMVDPLSFRELHHRIETLMERTVDTLSLSSVLQASGLVFDIEHEQWRVGLQQAVDEEE